MNLTKSLNLQSIQQKTLKRDLKDLEKKKNDQIKTLDNEMRSLKEFKMRHDAEQAALKRKEKKEIEKKKRDMEKVAKEFLNTKKPYTEEHFDLAKDSNNARWV